MTPRRSVVLDYDTEDRLPCPRCCTCISRLSQCTAVASWSNPPVLGDEVVMGGATDRRLHEETLWVSTARKVPARSSGVGSAAMMRGVTPVAASKLTAPGSAGGDVVVP